MTARNPDDTTDERSTERIELPTIQARIMMPPEHAGEVKAEAIGGDLIRMRARTRDCTTVGYFLDAGQARELAAELEEAAEEVVDE
jgi:hypothetical protein